VVALGLGVSRMVTGVAEALTIFWAVNTFTGLFMWLGVLWRRTNAAGAWASFAIMTVIWLALGQIGMRLKPLAPQLDWLGIYGDKSQLHLLVLSYMLPGLLALVAGSLLGKGVEAAQLDRFYLLLRTPVGQEGQLVEAGVPVVYAGSTEPHPWETKHPVAVNVLGFLAGLAFAFIILGMVYWLARLGA